ncbi:hypothetical protein POX_a00201 [Penicillium oxalicum]|nr:hypothetical protein POX_a00201 [Penicillium oxalicum]KAI2793620.1 hypothetical protein POX_a00201 [Penicillium oxalicum]
MEYDKSNVSDEAFPEEDRSARYSSSLVGEALEALSYELYVRTFFSIRMR